jgi:hypothetical protein
MTRIETQVHVSASELLSFQLSAWGSQGAAVFLGKYTRNRKNNTAQLKIIRFYYFKKNMKAMVII